MNYFKFLLATKAGIGKPGFSCSRLYWTKYTAYECYPDPTLVAALNEKLGHNDWGGASETFDRLPPEEQHAVIDRAIYLYQQQAL